MPADITLKPTHQKNAIRHRRATFYPTNPL